MLEALAELEPGSVLELITDCLQAINSIPLEVVRHGYRLLHEAHDGPTLRFYIEVPEGGRTPSRGAS